MAQTLTNDSLTVAATRSEQLTSAYTQTMSGVAGTVSVITATSQVDARAAALQAKLTALGITDLSQEGKLVLGGLTEITPGLRRGVAMSGTPIGTAGEIGLGTIPEYFEYTTAGRSTPLTAVASSATTRTATMRPVGFAAARLADADSLEADVLAATPTGATLAGTSFTSTPRLTEGRTLVMMSTPVLLADEAIIAVDELQLQDWTELLIANNVRYLTILATKITTGDNTVITWEATLPADRGLSERASDGMSHPRTSECSHSAFTADDGGGGGPGEHGETGYRGDDAPTVEIWALDVSRLPEFALKGGPGGTGQRGGDAGNGGHGAKGARAVPGVVWCNQGAGWGGDGGDGGWGGNGGLGGRGGRGGALILYLTDPCHEAVLDAGLTLDLTGGDGGEGGDGGAAGLRGLGGEAGDRWWPQCPAEPDRAGSPGTPGRAGDDGDRGLTGALAEPNLTAIVITEDEFWEKWSAPQIRTITPWEVEVGDVVQIEGANYPSTATVTVGGTAADATFFADTILQAEIPPVPSGWAEVLVDVPGGQTSNPASVKVLPSLFAVSPNPAALGVQITLTGAGFQAGCEVLFRGLELDASVDANGTQVQVTLPAPQGPFEDQGGVEEIFVRNPDGVATAPISLPLRHVLSTGFNVGTNGYSFLNAAANITGVANLGTFQETYGLFDVTLESLIDPVLTSAYFGFYLWFFNSRQPGYSSGFSMTAADEYWSGNTNLSGDHTSMASAERLLTVAQGHILSEELLEDLSIQAAFGVARAESALAEVEEVFRRQISLPADEAREIAPVMQLIPAGNILTPGFLGNLGQTHGLLPIRIEYAVSGEAWEKRLVVYDNAAAGGVGAETRIEFTRNGQVLDFVIDHLNLDGTLNSRDARSSSSGWTLSHVPLWFCWLMNVSMPLSAVWLMSPATLLVEDEQGRRFGTAGGRVWNDLPDARPAVGAPNLYLLPLDRNLRFTVTGTGKGTYTMGILDGPGGRSLTLTDVPVSPSTRDTIRITDRMREISIASVDPDKRITMHYGVGAGKEARALTVEGVRVGQQGGVTLREANNLSSFEVVAGQPRHPVTVGLMVAGSAGATRQEFEKVPVGGGRPAGFSVNSWEQLGAGSLQPKGPPGPR
jgi:hypothetical protein